MSNRNRDAGHDYERKILNRIKFLFPDIVTSRYESRSLDDMEVDFCNTHPFQFQCKLQKQTPSVDILNDMPKGKNIIIWGKTRRASVNMVKDGDYVIMKLDTFLDLI